MKPTLTGLATLSLEVYYRYLPLNSLDWMKKVKWPSRIFTGRSDYFVALWMMSQLGDGAVDQQADHHVTQPPE